MELIDILSRVAAGGFGLLIIAGFAFPVLFFLCFLIGIPISSIKEKRAEKEAGAAKAQKNLPPKAKGKK